MGAFLEGGEQRRADRSNATVDASNAAAEAQTLPQPPPRGDYRQAHLLAVSRLQDGAQLTQAVDQAKLQSAPRRPELAGEEQGIVTLELAAAALAHPVLEAVVDLGLQALQALDILGILVAKGIEH